MVYQKSDGTYGFSWRKQLDYLKQSEPDNVTGLLEATLFLRKIQHPAQADYYQQLYDALSRKIDGLVDECPHFGDKEEQQIARNFVRENNLETLLENGEEDTKTRSFWCYQCDDFTDHRPLDDDHTYCLVCSRERESALTRPMLADKRPARADRRWLIRGYTGSRWLYLNQEHRWTRFTDDAKQFTNKRAALEAFETTPRPEGFYPGLLAIDNRDEDFLLEDTKESETETSSSDLSPLPQISDNLLTRPDIAALLQPRSGEEETGLEGAFLNDLTNDDE